VALYFVQGWSCGHLARRYGVTAGRIRQVIHNWIERATALGYLQRIPPRNSIAIPVVQIAAASTMQGSSLSSPAPVLQSLAQQPAHFLAEESALDAEQGGGLQFVSLNFSQRGS
jgi:hypothetical protein